MLLRQTTWILLLLLLIFVGLESLYAQPAGYRYRKRVLLDSDQVSGSSSFTDFPLLVSVTDDDLRTEANGGGVSNNSGYDILVTSLAGVPLDQELQAYDPSTGTVIIWAKVGTLPATTDVEGYIYFGNDTVFTDQSTTDVWSSDFIGVWHLDDLSDATGNNSDLTNNSTTINTSGQIGSAREFDGDGDDLQDAGGDTYLDDLSSYTISLWAKADGTGSDRGLIHGREPNGNDNRIQIRYDAAGQSGGGTNVLLVNARMDDNGSRTNQILESSSSVQTTDWQHIVVTRAANSAFTLYLDGTADTPSASNARDGVTFRNDKLIIGRGAKDGTTSSWDGLIDEVWIENVERSADWVQTVYNNQSAPASFFSLQDINEDPVLSDIETVDLNYSTLSGPVSVTQAIAVQDWDDVYLDSAGAQIFTNYTASEDTLTFTSIHGITSYWTEGNAILHLTGNALQSEYEEALRSIKYTNSSASPSTLTRSVRFAVYDETGLSNLPSRDIVFNQPNNAPSLANLEGTTFSYPDSYGDTTLTAAITISDADDAYLDTAEISFTAGYISGEDILDFTNTTLLSKSWDGANGTLLLLGNASVSDYQSALRAVTYRNVNPDPDTGTRTIRFRVNDGDDWSTGSSRNLSVTALNNAPELDDIEAAALLYNAGDGAVALTDSIVVNDGDDTSLDSARVRIAENFFSTEDELDFTNQSGISGTWLSGVGWMLLGGSATVAEYQAALRDVTYENTATQPKSPTRRVAFEVYDGEAWSDSISRNIASGAPGTIDDLQVWLRADAGAFNNGAGTTPCSDGEGVQIWGDQSGNGRDFNDAVGVPVWRSNVTSLNGNPAIEFAGTGDHFRDGDAENYVDGTTEFTWFFVIQSDQTATDRGWLSARNPNGDDRDMIMRYDATGDNDGGSNVLLGGVMTDNAINQVESIPDQQSTDPQIVGLHWESGITMDLWLDGVLANASSVNPVGSLGIGRINIGQGPIDDTESWDGYIAEAIYYSRNLSEAERLKIEDYLSEKYAISTGLVDPADGGDSLSVDNIGGSYTTLAGPRITEDVLGELVDSGTLVLTAPSGFEWDTANSDPSVSISPAYGSSTDLDISYTSRTSSAVTFTVNNPSASPNKPGEAVFSDLRVRPTSSTLPSSGDITNTGTTGPSSSVNLGTLTAVAGDADSLVFAQAPSNGNAGEALAPDVSVQIVDQYGNDVALADTVVTISLSSGTGVLGGTLSDSTNVDGLAEFDSLSISTTGSKRLTAKATGLDSVQSAVFSIFPSGDFTTFLIERSSGGDILDQTAGSAFTIKISAVDATETVDTDFTGTVDLTTSSAFITGGGTTSNFTAGVLSTHTVNLSDDGTHTLTATNSTGSESGTSNAFDVDASAASPATTQITASPTVIANNGIATSTITVTVTDAYDNVLSDGGETVNLETDAGTLLGTVSDNSDGTYTQTLRASTTAETATVSGLLNLVNIQDSAEVEFNDYSTVWQSSPGDADSTREWELASNWTNGVPTSTDDALIPASPANGTRQPVISTTDQQINSLTVVSGADVTLSGSIRFEILGDLLGEGELNGGTSDTVEIAGDVEIDDLDIGYVILDGSSQQDITAALAYQNLELNNSAGAHATGDVSVNDTLKLTSGTFEIPSGYTIIANKQVVDSGKIQAEREINGSNGWRMLAAPLISTYADFLDSIFTQGYTGSDSAGRSPSVLWYDETYAGTDNQRWRKPDSANQVTVPGRGLFVYVFGDIDGDTIYTDPLPKVLDIAGTEDQGTGGIFNFGVTYTASADTGWNLVGNPFPATLDWDAAGWTKTNMDNTIYVWDNTINSGNGGYLTWNGSTGSLGDGKLPAFQSFWVKANASSPVLSVNLSNKTTGGVFYKVTTPPIQIVLHAELDSLEALTHLQFHAAGSLRKDALDAFQLEAPTETRLDLFTTGKGNQAYAIQVLPTRFGLPLEIPVHVDALLENVAVGGEFLLQWPQLQNIPAGWQLTLRDRETGTEIDLLTTTEYRFQQGSAALDRPVPPDPREVPAMPTRLTRRMETAAARLVLIINPGDTNPEIPRQYALDTNYPNPFNPATKIRFDLPLEAAVTMEIYDILGRRIAQPLDRRVFAAGRHEVEWRAEGHPSGIYFYRVVLGQYSFTRKMTVLR